MNETDKAWLACAIDGEGSIYVRSQKSRRGPVFIGVYNSNIDFVKRAVKITGTGKIHLQTRNKIRERDKRPMYRFEVNNHKKILAVLNEILPYLIIKKERAKEAISFIENYNWRFNLDDLDDRMVNFIRQQAVKLGDRSITKLVKAKFGIFISPSVIYKVIKKNGSWVRYCKRCGNPFEVSQRYKRYCPEHTLAK